MATLCSPEQVPQIAAGHAFVLGIRVEHLAHLGVGLDLEEGLLAVLQEHRNKCCGGEHTASQSKARVAVAGVVARQGANTDAGHPGCNSECL